MKVSVDAQAAQQAAAGQYVDTIIVTITEGAG